MRIGCFGWIFIVVLGVFLIPSREDQDFSSLRVEDPPAWEVDTNWRPKPKNIKTNNQDSVTEEAIEEVINNQEYYVE